MKMYDAILRKLYELCVTKCVTECVFLLVGATRALSFSCHSRVDGNDDDADSRKHAHAIDKRANERWWEREKARESMRKKKQTGSLVQIFSKELKQ